MSRIRGQLRTCTIAKRRHPSPEAIGSIALDRRSAPSKGLTKGRGNPVFGRRWICLKDAPMTFSKSTTPSLGASHLRSRVVVLWIIGALAWASPWQPIEAAAARQYSSYEDVVSSGLPQAVLIKVIARNFKSKTYTQLVPLDGGTVGIANFAAAGLGALYGEMDTQKYFGKSAAEMVTDYSAKCLLSGKRGKNDTGWGCYSKGWWRNGMSRFLASPELEGNTAPRMAGHDEADH